VCFIACLQPNVLKSFEGVFELSASMKHIIDIIRGEKMKSPGQKVEITLLRTSKV
jgi:hypothetical protein